MSCGKEYLGEQCKNRCNFRGLKSRQRDKLQFLFDFWGGLCSYYKIGKGIIRGDFVNCETLQFHLSRLLLDMHFLSIL